MRESAFRSLISNERRGTLAVLARLVLRGLSLPYAGVVRCRNFAFDRGWQAVHRPEVPVISIGNITTGGTGKTPIVAWVASWFHSRGIRVVLLSRGYRGQDGGANDEKLVLEQLCPGVPHLQGADRAALAERACRELAAELLILDDGFQHRRLARDLDVVLVDGLCPWGYGHLLPRGLLREPRSSLARADVAILTRSDQLGSNERDSIQASIAEQRGTIEPVEAAFCPTALINSRGERESLEQLQGRTVIGFCGIGNPESFRRLLDRLGARVVAFRDYPDHHHYTAEDLAEIGQNATHHLATLVVTTQKDLVKIADAQLAGVPLWAVEIGAEMTRGAEILDARLESILAAVLASRGSSHLAR